MNGDRCVVPGADADGAPGGAGSHAARRGVDPTGQRRGVGAGPAAGRRLDAALRPAARPALRRPAAGRPQRRGAAAGAAGAPNRRHAAAHLGRDPVPARGLRPLLAALRRHLRPQRHPPHRARRLRLPIRAPVGAARPTLARLHHVIRPYCLFVFFLSVGRRGHLVGCSVVDLTG